MLFGAFTDQRPYCTIAQLRVGQLRKALQLEKPVVRVEPALDKIRMEHYVPLHRQVAGVMNVLCDGADDAARIFTLESFRKWIQKQRIPLKRCTSHFVTSDLRKFAEQHGDIVGCNKSNRAHILTHGVRSIGWSNYRHPLPEHVYDVYMQYWADVRLAEAELT